MHTLPVESGREDFGVQCTTPGVPFADSHLIATLVYTFIFWSFPFFSGLKMVCFWGSVGLAAALWDHSFVCSVFNGGVVYEYPDEIRSFCFVIFLCLLLFSDLGHVEEPS